MRKSWILAGFAVVAVALAAAVAGVRAKEGTAAQPAAGVSASKPAPQAEELAIRRAVDAWVRAYNAGDAKALASLFRLDGEVIDEDGNRAQGREAIEGVFHRIFKENPKSHVEVAIQSIRFLSPTVALEEGTSTAVHNADQPAQRSRYTVVHVKQASMWQMLSARDLPSEAPFAEEQLKPLAWLIGDWVDESPEALVATSYHWADNRCYILGEFTVKIGGRPAMTGSQRIGWDPLAKKIRSWVFDSEGGFAEGVWTRQGNRWIVKMTGVTREGKPASSTNVTTHVSKDRMTWQSRDRVVGGEAMPDSEQIPVVRKPPKPM